MVNVKDNSINEKKKMAASLAWIGLVIIIIIIAVMAYGMITQNGKLALAMIVALAFVSILYWIGISAYKKMQAKDEEIYKEQTRKDMINLASMNTKNM